MTNQELLDFLKQCKELGMTEVEVDGKKFKFGQPEIKQETKLEDLTVDEIMAKPHPLDTLTDEEVLFWSTPHGIDLIEERTREYEENIKRQTEIKNEAKHEA